MIPSRPDHSQGERLGTYGTQSFAAGATGSIQAGAVCGRCGAWRGELGGEPTLELYVAHLVEVFREVRRVLRDDGSLFLNLGDSYCSTDKWGGGKSGNAGKHTVCGSGVVPSWASVRAKRPAMAGNKPKDLIEVPSEVVRALKADGWWLRSRMPWLKRNCMPESVTDRPTSAVEYVFLLTKRASYWWDAEAVKRCAKVREYGPEKIRRARNVGGRKDGFTGTDRGYGLGHNGSRNLRNADLWFDSRAPGFWDDGDGPAGLLLDEAGDPLALEVNPTPSGLPHFAQFPPKLVGPLILASTSERGVCPACGAPWGRLVERHGETAREKGERVGFNGYVEAYGDNPQGLHHAGHRGNSDRRARTTGWAPRCACDAGDPIPATVLDPFVGVGTTLLVADRLGRNGVGIELNGGYAADAYARVLVESPLFADVEIVVPDPPTGVAG